MGERMVCGAFVLWGAELRIVLVFVFLVCAGVAKADPSVTLGVGRLFSNDYLGDGHDRWQSGSYVLSILRGPAHGVAPVREYRLRSSVLSSDGRSAEPSDRPYVGALSFGAHLHGRKGKINASVGFDITAIGPQTGLSRFQRRAHDTLGMQPVRFMDKQLGNNLFVGMTAEVAADFLVTATVTARPFAQVLVGPEDLLRIGADVRFGAPWGGAIWPRDVTTGHLYQTTAGTSGFAFLVGADIAVVRDSVYLRGKTLNDRTRLRAGVQWQGAGATRLFYGITYLSPDFQDQDGGQVTGSVQLKVTF